MQDYLLASPEVLLVPAKAVSVAAETLKERRQGEQGRVQAALQRLLRWAELGAAADWADGWVSSPECAYTMVRGWMIPWLELHQTRAACRRAPVRAVDFAT